MRIITLLLGCLFATSVFAQTPTTQWRAYTRGCFISLRDADSDWRLRVEIFRRAGGRAGFLIRVNEPMLPTPVVGQRVRISWSTIAFGDRNFTLPINRVLARTEQRAMTVEANVAAGAGLDGMIERAGLAQTLKVTLPESPPIAMPSLGFREAWAALEGCSAGPTK